jgi:8-oxo-dGTP pyrophosphatase MutT (NUDIX family)
MRLSNQIRADNLSKVLKPASDEQNANASVALILNLEKKDFSVLFVKRVEDSLDPWSGQIGLPGGKRETNDKNLKECVIRETLEETGINFFNGRFLGSLPAFRTVNKPKLVVLPFVILFKNKPLIKLNEEELYFFFWIQLQQIHRSKRTARIGSRQMPAHVIGENVIWGLTYRIVESLLQRI